MDEGDDIAHGFELEGALLGNADARAVFNFEKQFKGRERIEAEVFPQSGRRIKSQRFRGIVFVASIGGYLAKGIRDGRQNGVVVAGDNVTHESSPAKSSVALTLPKPNELERA